MTTETAAEWISYAGAARRLGVSGSTLRRLVEAGRLSSRRVPGGRPRVKAAEVDRLLAASTTPAK